MSKQMELTERLNQEFQPHFILVENESHKHSSGLGADSHFKVVLVSDKFEAVSKIARHRLVYQLLAEDLQQGIHALALHLYTPLEWEKCEAQFPKSPSCVGAKHS
ncbi:BolA/IbaG family iron-sulfur metabolism protein [[Haemophilus] felis]|uniref:Transcriptional regulator n=1 Tax=[Haemophilus] felis TaxID=123822 RepID=A0A1T0AVZ2_9PAST|nr:BolA/IbaG family iron-sulfur metabolism protein [[Haemophilus] felis]NBI41597.1 BolA/IbaG family iron-sulfur metabolism protein [[Haemophilus] felis]NBI42705.1 BolA/IbaG family iron-sulfur metabolism protein [[Haemophilus] felis]OOS01325.1 transcriptional regulator [[Haemophilus] felis]